MPHLYWHRGGGGSAKSGDYHYYSCYNYLRRGKAVCDSKITSAEKLERVLIEKLKERVLTPENLKKLLQLVNEEITRLQSTKGGEIESLNRQIAAKQSKLDRLYDALESGGLELADLAPRIKKLKEEVDQFQQQLGRLQLELASGRRARTINMKELTQYVDDLRVLLSEGEFFERRGFLKSFIRRIDINYPQVEVKYTVPVMQKPPKDSEVLSIVNYGGLYETHSATGSLKMPRRKVPRLGDFCTFQVAGNHLDWWPISDCWAGSGKSRFA